MNSDDKKTILLVEDEVIIAMLETQQLEEKGYIVHHVNNGEVAVKTILEEDFPVDLILMDIDLGSGIDGTQAAEEILKEKDIPIVFLSSHTEPEVVEKTEKITSYGYVVKNSGMVVLDTSIKMAFKLFDANQKIKSSDVYQKNMISNITDVIGIIGVDGIMKYKSSNIEKWFGWQPQDLIGTDGWLTVHPDDLERIQKEFYKLLEKDNSSATVEYLYKCKDGSYKPIELSATNLTKNPQIEGVLLNYHDITERKKAEEALRESELLFSQLFEQAIVSTQLLDIEGNTIRVNSTFCKLFGVTTEDMMHYKIFEDNAIKESDAYEPLMDVFENKIPRRWYNQFNIAHASESSGVKTTRPEIVFLENLSYPILDNKNDLQYVVIQHFDITERRRTQEELRKSEEDLKKAQAITHIGSWYLDIETNHVTWTEELYKMYGFDPSKPVPPYTEHMKLFTPESWVILSDSLANTAKTGVPYELELVTFRKDGSNGWMWVRGEAVKDENNKIIGLWGAAQDITDRKQAEEEIKKQLSEKELLMREVHHRVKNNIGNIESFLALQSNSTDNPEAKSVIKDAVSRVQSMRILYDKLLVSKDLREISIKNYIEDLIDSLQNVFVEKGNIVIEKHISDFTIKSKEAISIGIIINELLTNVFKYAFKDSDKGTVSVSIEQTETMSTIIIQDNGIGIDERILENKSPGFGLTIVKMLTEQLKGTCSMVNDNGTKSIIQFER